MDGLACLVPITPVVSGSYAALANVEVLWVVDILVGTGLYAIDDARLEIYEDSSRNVSRVVALVVEDIFPITAFCRKVLEVAILIDAVFLTELLPKLATDWIVLAYSS